MRWGEPLTDQHRVPEALVGELLHLLVQISDLSLAGTGGQWP